ncbi:MULTISPECIES: hypothetical protein [unclassified Streptomyces]|uniref:hypothetical protein n=1 Tax=unclassified Streptomyces TaxID=2593676 RepID=UPI0037FF5DB9
MSGLGGVGVRYRREDFEVDGALRDVCILDASINDWQNLLEGLARTDWSVHFAWTLSDSNHAVIPDARSLFTRLESDPEESARLAVKVGGIWFTCYFFDENEIEFTFDPEDVDGPTSFCHLEAFIRQIGDATHRSVLVTMEGTDHRAMPALIEYSPS